jgi:hypothetical protein
MTWHEAKKFQISIETQITQKSKYEKGNLFSSVSYRQQRRRRERESERAGERVYEYEKRLC